jgi:hypothetical protein
MESEAAKLRKTLQKTLIDGETQRAIAAAKGNVRMLMPHVTAHIKMIEDERTGEFRARDVDRDGDERYNSTGEPMSFMDLVNEMKNDPDFAMNFEGSSGSAHGASGSGCAGGGGAKKAYSRSEWRNLMARADKEPKDGGVAGGRAQLMKDYAAGKVAIAD